MSIDPGLGGTGYAVWSRATASKLELPLESGSIPSAEGTLQVRMAWICACIRHTSYLRGVCEIVIEKPAFMEGGKGIVAARDGDLVTLSILVGALIGHMWRTENGREVAATYGTHLVDVVDWKGNMSKEMTEVRVKQKLPKWRSQSNTTHEADAVGLGLYAKGMF